MPFIAIRYRYIEVIDGLCKRDKPGKEQWGTSRVAAMDVARSRRRRSWVLALSGV